MFGAIEISSFSAFGETHSKAPACSFFHKASFAPAEQGLRELQQPLALIATTVDIRTTHERCSGNFISDEGHILLASHCLGSCDPQSGLNSTTSALARDLNCEAKINGQSRRFHIEFKSRCSHDADLAVIIAKEQKSLIPPQFLHCGAAADLAVIKLDEMPKDARCLQLASSQLELGDAVFSLSRPGFTSRGGDSRNSNGFDLYATSGKRIQSQTCHLKKVSKDIFSVLTMDFSNDSGDKNLGLNSEFYSKHFIQSTNDAYVGSSGSSLMDKNGRVAGVTVRINNLNSDSRECVGATYSEPISRLSQTAKSWNPDYVLSKIKCTKRRAIPIANEKAI